MSNIERKPKIRFPEFTDAWEQRKFGDILKIYSFKSFFNGICDDGRFEVIQQGDTPILGYGNGNPFEDYKDVVLFGDHTLSLYKPNSPFFVATDGIKILGSNCNLDRNFLFTVLERYKPMSEGYKRHFTILKNSDLCFCKNIDEQKKIGEYFCNLDNLITLHQRKLEILKNLKKSFLQKLFPQKDNKVPELRFPGFSGDWEQRELKKIVDKAVDNRGKTPSFYSSGRHPLIEVASLGSCKPDYSKVSKYLDDNAFDNELRAHVEENDILFSTVGNVGLVSLMDNHLEACIAQNIVAFRAKENIDAKYLYALFSNKENQKKVQRIVMGAVQPSIKVSQLVNEVYTISPNNEEQMKIGSYFEQLDNLITLHQRKLEILQNIKKGFLQQMFV